MAQNRVLKFEGDLRLWSIPPGGGANVPILDDPLDIFGNIPIEASASIFGYEAGEEISVVSKRRDRYNQTIYSEQEPGQSNLSLTLVAVPPAILARVFYGEAAEVTVTGAAVEDEEITFTADELSQPLAHDRLASSPAPTVTTVDELTTYVAGVDYAIDLRLGRVRRLAGGSIPADGTVRVNYTYTSYTLTRIRGGVQPQENFYLLGDMKNRPDGKDMRLEVYQANLSTDGEVDLFASEPITVTLTGPLITPEDKTEPYLVDLHD